MQNYGHMPMPQPPGGVSYRPNAGNWQSSGPGPTSSSQPPYLPYGPPASQPYSYGSMPTTYGTTSYTTSTPAPSQDSVLDNDMRTLIRNLKSTLEHASMEELDTLLKNEDRLNGLIEETQQIKNLKQKRNELINNNKEQATFNLSLQPQFESLKERLSEAVLLQSSRKEEYDILKSKLESIAGNFSLDATLALLQTSAAEKDGASEALANQLLECKLPMEEFLEQFICERTGYHLRKIKADKMAEIVRRGPHMQQQSPQYYGSGYGRY